MNRDQRRQAIIDLVGEALDYVETMAKDDCPHAEYAENAERALRGALVEVHEHYRLRNDPGKNAQRGPRPDANAALRTAEKWLSWSGLSWGLLTGTRSPKPSMAVMRILVIGMMEDRGIPRDDICLLFKHKRIMSWYKRNVERHLRKGANIVYATESGSFSYRRNEETGDTSGSRHPAAEGEGRSAAEGEDSDGD